jgi:arginine decarboxylase
VRQGRVELRQLRRPEDPFVYEGVTVPSFEEGVVGVVMNADVQAVVIKDNFRFKSQFDAPLLRTYWTKLLFTDRRPSPILTTVVVSNVQILIQG